ncbi:MAG: hypothetical protein ABIN67_02940 [Ferruginibacter sp.]
MQKVNEFKELVTQQDFLNTLKIDEAIIYFFVDWSGQERVSQSIIKQALDELEALEIPIFKVDCSDQSKHYVVSCVIEQQKNRNDLYHGGCGETLLIEKGEIIGFIKYPGQLGLVKTKEILQKWANTSGNKSIHVASGA